MLVEFLIVFVIELVDFPIIFLKNWLWFPKFLNPEKNFPDFSLVESGKFFPDYFSDETFRIRKKRYDKDS